jgi:hypothetical protein
MQFAIGYRVSATLYSVAQLGIPELLQAQARVHTGIGSGLRGQ